MQEELDDDSQCLSDDTDTEISTQVSWGWYGLASRKRTAWIMHSVTDVIFGGFGDVCL